MPLIYGDGMALRFRQCGRSGSWVLPSQGTLDRRKGRRHPTCGAGWEFCSSGATLPSWATGCPPCLGPKLMAYSECNILENIWSSVRNTHCLWPMIKVCIILKYTYSLYWEKQKFPKYGCGRVVSNFHKWLFYGILCFMFIFCFIFLILIAQQSNLTHSFFFSLKVP